MSLSTLLNDSDLNKCQCEDLKGLLRSNSLMLKDQEFKHTKMVENYEAQVSRLNEENKQLKDKYEKILDAQRKLEKLNSDLEERLLKIVEKYEIEQKNLLEELTIAHSSLVESKLQIEELEKEKELYRQDCNLAVNLLQCKPNEFVNHSYKYLPFNIKERLKSHLSSEELIKIENNPSLDQDQAQTQKIQQLPKIPIFQPSAAVALMYNFQETKQIQQKKTDSQPDSSYYSSITLEEDAQNDLKINTNLLAKVLKKDSDNKSKKSFKLLPYICLRCKKEAIMCDSPTQTDPNDLNQSTKVLFGNPKPSILLHERSKSISNRLNELPTYLPTTSTTQPVNKTHNRYASTDLGFFKNSTII